MAAWAYKDAGVQNYSQTFLFQLSGEAACFCPIGGDEFCLTQSINGGGYPISQFSSVGGIGGSMNCYYPKAYGGGGGKPLPGGRNYCTVCCEFGYVEGGGGTKGQGPFYL